MKIEIDHYAISPTDNCIYVSNYFDLEGVHIVNQPCIEFFRQGIKCKGEIGIWRQIKSI